MATISTGQALNVIAAMAAGRIDATGWVTTVPLNEAEHALHELRAGRGMKILVEP